MKKHLKSKNPSVPISMEELHDLLVAVLLVRHGVVTVHGEVEFLVAGVEPFVEALMEPGTMFAHLPPDILQVMAHAIVKAEALFLQHGHRFICAANCDE